MRLSFLLLLRPHSRLGCFQTGYVKNGNLVFAGAVSSTCPNGPAPHRSWFKAEVEVHGKVVKILKDDKLVRVVKSHFDAIGKGGVLLANGYQNTIRYKNYRIRKLPSYPYPVSSCQSVVKQPNFVKMVGAPGSKWPRDGFCRTLITKSVAGSHYSITVSLFNEKGWNRRGGHLGILYNARDLKNFDFVYFR